jgi:hypothetical protein
VKTFPSTTLVTVTALVSLAGLAGCGSMAGRQVMGAMTGGPYSQATLPDAVKVPAGHQVVWETVGVGEITYECRPKATATSANEFEWVFVGPKAALNDRSGKQVGKYFGPPATWEALDGSKLTATQLAVAPAGSGNLPLQLVKANPAVGMGALNGVTHIQRVATRGGTAPGSLCSSATAGTRSVVNYQADYIFWKQG